MCLKLNCPTSALDLCCFHNNAAMLSVTFHASSSLCLLPFLSLPHLIRQVPVYSLNFWSPPLSHHTCPSSSPNDVHPGYDNSLPEDGPASLNSATNCTLFLPKWHLLTQKTKSKVLSLAGKLVQSQSPSLFQAWLSPHGRLPRPHSSPWSRYTSTPSSCL